MAAVRSQIFLCKQFFSTAGFELFCRIFGRLATLAVATFAQVCRGNFQEARVVFYISQKRCIS
jgi:hypothetical protein